MASLPIVLVLVATVGTAWLAASGDGPIVTVSFGEEVPSYHLVRAENARRIAYYLSVLLIRPTALR